MKKKLRVLPIDSQLEKKNERIVSEIFFAEKKKKTIVFCNANEDIASKAFLLMLGETLSQKGKRVVVVDAGMRCAKDDNETQLGQGLVHFLSGQCELESVIHSTAISNVDFVSPGAVVSNPIFLLESDRFEQLMDYCRERYDWVFINTSPLEPNDVSAAKLSLLADGVILMVQDRVTRESWLREAKMTLESVGSRIIGCVVVDVKKEEKYM